MNDFIMLHKYNGNYLAIRKSDIKKIEVDEECSLITTYNEEEYYVSESIPLIVEMLTINKKEL